MSVVEKLKVLWAHITVKLGMTESICGYFRNI